MAGGDDVARGVIQAWPGSTVTVVTASPAATQLIISARSRPADSHSASHDQARGLTSSTLYCWSRASNLNSTSTSPSNAIGRQQRGRRGLDLVVGDDLDERRGVAEIDRILARAARGDLGHRLAVMPQRRHRKTAPRRRRGSTPARRRSRGRRALRLRGSARPAPRGVSARQAFACVKALRAVRIAGFSTTGKTISSDAASASLRSR